MKPEIAFVLGTMYATLFGVGCWEANLARQHPTSHSSPDLNGYIYTLFSCVTNLVGGLVLGMLTVRDSIHNSVYRQDSSITVGCVVAVWSILLFATMADMTLLAGPFQAVVIAQFAITMLFIALCCFVCAGFARLGANYIQYRAPVPYHPGAYPEEGTDYIQV
jgi:hypothetical protein